MHDNPPAPTFENGEASTTLDLRVYRLAAVKKAAYRVAARITVVLGSPIDDRMPVVFKAPRRSDDASAREGVRLFYQELLDQELREQIAEETTPLRMLILAQAFSKTDLIRRE